MFGGDLFEKLGDMKKIQEEAQQRLEKLTVEGEAGGNLVIVELNGNRKMTKLTLNTDLSRMDKEDLEDLLTVAFNRALEKAEVANQSDMQNAAKGLFPGM